MRCRNKRGLTHPMWRDICPTRFGVFLSRQVSKVTTPVFFLYSSPSCCHSKYICAAGQVTYKRQVTYIYLLWQAPWCCHVLTQQPLCSRPASEAGSMYLPAIGARTVVSTVLPAMIAPRTYAHTVSRSPNSRAKQRLSSAMIRLLMIPRLRRITFLFPPLHATLPSL
jgi:hypothetical protein